MLENAVIVWCWTNDPILLEAIGLKLNNGYAWWQRKTAKVEGEKERGREKERFIVFEKNIKLLKKLSVIDREKEFKRTFI